MGRGAVTGADVGKAGLKIGVTVEGPGEVTLASQEGELLVTRVMSRSAVTPE